MKPLSFDAFKREVFRLAKKGKAGHLIPNGDTLYRLWELKTPPAEVVEKHCTAEAQKKRFN
jgi:hypothetical protein